MKVKTLGPVLIHAFIGWALCSATIGIGMSVTTEENTLIIHVIVTPVFFWIIAMNYFKKYNHFSPIKIAIAFIVFVIFVDFFVVALLILRSLEMFYSLLGTWIPFLLIFLSTYLTGIILTRKTKTAV
jgi:hypothetical protein